MQESHEGNLGTFTDCNATRVQRTSEDQTKVWIVTLSLTFEAHPANPTPTKALRGHPHDVLQNVIIMPDWSTDYRHASWYFCGSGNAERHKRDARDRGWMARRSNGDHRNTVRPNAGQVTTNATKGLDRHFAATPDRKTHHQHGPAAELHNTSFRCPRTQKNTHPSIWSAAHPDNDAGTNVTKQSGSHGVRFGVSSLRIHSCRGSSCVGGGSCFSMQSILGDLWREGRSRSPFLANPRDLGGRPGRPNHPIANLVFALLEDAFPVTRRHSNVMSNSGAPKQSRLSTEVLNFDAPQLACRMGLARPHILYDAICHTTHPYPALVPPTGERHGAGRVTQSGNGSQRFPPHCTEY